MKNLETPGKTRRVGRYGNIGRFQKISIPIPRTAFRISEGEGGGVHDYGMLRAWGGIYVWKSEGMGDSIGGISGEESVQ